MVEKKAKISHTARFWEKHLAKKEGQVKCLLCPHHCLIASGKSGICMVRKNEQGTLVAEAYGKITSIALDPIEKKPLYYYHPGSNVLSVGSYGCNLSCSFCQNWTIASRRAEYEYLDPASLARLSADYKRLDSIGVAFTYNEPLINWEYVYESAVRIKANGQKNILVTNGFINARPLDELLPYIDAMNIDLKSFHDQFYRKTCGGRLQPVLDTIARCAGRCHLEITTLLIPGLNDSEEEIDQLAAWLATIDPATPLHLTRHHPAYKMMQPQPIEIDRMNKLADIARRYLSRVRLGNTGN